MQITSEGQVTIPREIRDRLGFLPNTEVEFKLDGDQLLIRKAYPTPVGSERVREAIERARGSGDIDMSTDEIMALMRGEG